MKYILVASDNQATGNTIRECLSPEYRVDVASDRNVCWEIFNQRRYEFVFIDIDFLRREKNALSFNDYKQAFQPFWQKFPSVPIIVLAPQAAIREAVNAVKAGASNYLAYPVSPTELKFVIENIHEALRTQSELDYLRDEFWQRDSLSLVRTKNPEMKKVFAKIRLVAPTKSTVILYGETGTGKGVIAKLIRQHSNRREKSFITVHCGAVPDTLVESELFGHEKGAFTGAHRRKLGKFELAQSGTIFLDEVATITLSAQVKLLQVLQEKTFQRVGGEEDIFCDVRIIAATNVDLKKLSDEGAFRKDLYYRLHVFPIEVPSLRERREDIPFLAETFLQRLNDLYSKNISGIHPRVMDALSGYSWPGNVRELENLIERAYILETSSILTAESFPAELFGTDLKAALLSFNGSVTMPEARRRGVEHCERYYLNELLALHKGRIKESAQTAGISVRQLHKLLTKYQIRKDDFKSRT
ncbi:MAG: sigma-54 dependent transcriptional regulator [Candidatus Euphemobacter frigidus]|nr:sigma-54 dependent transcriptional regulator [Candidatus Euphemobacter frigidus]MDP8275021.1 sigma-54 dependent transcriptional regulator [Candidatus Euphemobacter frigidus]